MVAYLGMSDKVGNMSYYDSSGQGEMALTKPYSEQTAELIDKEVKRLLDDAFALATKVLREHRDGFTQLAELLLEKEVVFSEDLERIFGKRIKDIKREQAEAAAAAGAGRFRPRVGDRCRTGIRRGNCRRARVPHPIGERSRRSDGLMFIYRPGGRFGKRAPQTGSRSREGTAVPSLLLSPAEESAV